MGLVTEGRIAMSLPPVLQYELGVERAAILLGRDLSRRPAAQRGTVAAVRNRIGQLFVATGRRIMSDRPAVETPIADFRHLSLSK